MCDQPPDEEELCAYMRLRELRVDKTASPAKSKPENKRRKERNEKQSRYRGTFDRNKISAFLKKLFQAGGKGVTGIIGSYLPPTCEVRGRTSGAELNDTSFKCEQCGCRMCDYHAKMQGGLKVPRRGACYDCEVYALHLLYY
eukprot:CAMPEP_0170167976 /NCGR_PEP_ID=MMETSP0040_2-20121228/1198_1 /TAXON_ID=641309 /ORGANISM="Lotharella oceanica, Strain CCMP622" /LENGTH=141 /DNA_ID=CAMNT_0010406127 /DNA_START=24 /DNA_END=449 /DNA_ORIENTATION=+